MNKMGVRAVIVGEGGARVGGGSIYEYLAGLRSVTNGYTGSSSTECNSTELGKTKKEQFKTVM